MLRVYEVFAKCTLRILQKRDRTLEMFLGFLSKIEAITVASWPYWSQRGRRPITAESWRIQTKAPFERIRNRGR
ncbi:hypothetical protein BHQ31_06140 [Burkholderia cenocepacia]|nr:hypothetical protein BHQ31_06140 [Burkholderia cenocepacia]